ncbi:MAG: glycosyltransferase family 2 protein, partial [Tetragenococcus koreensis]|nr:glycosyltransferase family 2 protein [Tetragenococcus koreensis]
MYLKSLISIVIPVYNVEKYLENCLQSIQNQTYNHFEVILVNDGSTDSSLSICEKFVNQDKRFSVLSKENGGLSSARNFGIKKAKGSFITFVDSDDYIVKDYLSHLVAGIKSETSIVCSKFFPVDEKGNLLTKKEAPKKKSEVVSSEESIKIFLLQNGYDHSAWGKLYPVSFFETISFPVGKLYEDMGTTYKLLKLASEVVFLDAYDYAYLQRPNSIMNSSFNLKKLDIIEMVHEMENDILAQFPNLACQIKNRAFAAEVEIFLEIPKKKEFEQAQKKLWHEIKENRKAPFMTKDASLKNKLAASLAFLGKSLFLTVLLRSLKIKRALSELQI